LKQDSHNLTGLVQVLELAVYRWNSFFGHTQRIWTSDELKRRLVQMLADLVLVHRSLQLSDNGDAVSMYV